MRKRVVLSVVVMLGCLVTWSCKDSRDPAPSNTDKKLVLGGDLSYLNEMENNGAVYKDKGQAGDAYAILKSNGGNIVRFRLWYNPTWTKEAYGEAGTQMYCDLADVIVGIQRAKAQGLQVMLDFHYSDIWADPANQNAPLAWKEITSLQALKDSVYNYTARVLTTLKSRNLMPEYVQPGNEINCGLFYTEKPSGFPDCEVCTGNNWSNLGGVLSSAIKAIRDVSASGSVKSQVVLHVADPKNVDWWFDALKFNGGVTDFDVVGISYYPLWHTTVSVDLLSSTVALAKTKYGKKIMIVETAYPWTTDFADTYSNAFGDLTPLPGYPYTQAGQLAMIKKIVTEVVEGGGDGVIYWEPAWISTSAKDLWGTGSSWENCTLFDFNGNTIQGITFMNYPYN